ncbi:ABI gene family member 3, partial [Heterocephalus glaber]
QLQDFEIPAGREALRGNHAALLRVADFCEDNYVQATDKRKALEETMAFTTQALASVAYQVGNLAGHTLRMLDLQGTALRQVEARVSALGQMVNMHLEKVARREIGTLAAVQRLYPGQKVLAPESLAPPPPYCRRPINFSCLDHVGHGIKVQRGALPPQSLRSSPFGCLRQHHAESRQASNSQRSFCLSLLGTDTACATTPSAPHVLIPACNPLPWLSPRSPNPSTAPPCAPPVALGGHGLRRSYSPVSVPAELPPPLTPELEDLGLPPPPPGFGLEEPSWAPDAYLEKVVTLYPYTRQKDNELSFTEGTIICVTRRYSDGWWEGVSAEGAGFFPGNYVVPGC